MRRKERCRPTPRVRKPIPTPAVAGTFAQHTAQPHANPRIEGRKRAVTVFEVRKPAHERAIEIVDDDREATPYGATTIAGGQGELQPRPEDLAIARALGRRVAEIAAKLRG